MIKELGEACHETDDERKATLKNEDEAYKQFFLADKIKQLFLKWVNLLEIFKSINIIKTE